jgi:two-component system, NtrC family, nitrogen regulation response regulator NtrX
MVKPDEPVADEAPRHTILVVDDERNIRRALGMILQSEGYHVAEAETAEAGHLELKRVGRPVDLIVLDLMLPKKPGLGWLAELKADAFYRHIPVIVISGHASSEESAQAIKLGAVDFFEKPLNRERVLVSVQKALENAGLVRQLVSLSAALGTRHEMIGGSAAMQRLYRDIERVAPTKANVLITGPSGTGKELISRAIHRLSTRAEKPFVKVNCAAIPRELIESELFGHEKGSFTGAEKNKRGLFEQAHGATMFLDEIGDMDLTAQAKVLRVLQSGELQRVGSESVFTVDVRVLAATNKDLEKEVAEGNFRDDLFFRLNVFPIRVPNLESRAEDIPLLVESFIKAFCVENGLRQKSMRSEVLAALQRRRWPGNVRELKNVVERAVILAGDEITMADLPEDPHEDPFNDDAPLAATSPAAATLDGRRASLRELREQAERSHIVDALVEFDWNVSRAAAALGVERTNLHKKIRAYNIRRGEN